MCGEERNPAKSLRPAIGMGGAWVKNFGAYLPLRENFSSPPSRIKPLTNKVRERTKMLSIFTLNFNGKTSKNCWKKRESRKENMLLVGIAGGGNERGQIFRFVNA